MCAEEPPVVGLWKCGHVAADTPAPRIIACGPARIRGYHCEEIGKASMGLGRGHLARFVCPDCRKKGLALNSRNDSDAGAGAPSSSSSANPSGNTVVA